MMNIKRNIDKELGDEKRACQSGPNNVILDQEEITTCELQ